MKIKRLLLTGAALFAAVSFNINLRAATPQPLGGAVAGRVEFQTVAFSDSKEAGMLRNAYVILATGDHDYKGHRAKAMRQIEAAARLLGVKLAGDDKDRQKQGLSDAELREAQGLLQSVLAAAQVKDQPRISKHLNGAINQINLALSVR